VNLVYALLIAALCASALVACAPAWNARVKNDLEAATQIQVTGPGKCSTAKTLPVDAMLNIDCNLQDGTAITFTDVFGHACKAEAAAVARQVQTGEVGPKIWPKKFLFVRLSQLPCH
jgi:hypothetical protein